MSIPIISKTQGALAFALGQPFVFQFAATGNPTLWSLAAHQVVPHGFVFNALTGMLAGAGTSPGVWQLTLTASNAEGASAPETFTIGVFETASQEITKKLVVDTQTWAVTLPDPAPARPAISGVPALEAAAGQGKFGEGLLLSLAFTEGSTEFTPRLAMARLAMGTTDATLPPFYETPAWTFRRSVEVLQGAFETRFFLHVPLDSPDLGTWLDDFETDTGTEGNVRCTLTLDFEKPQGASAPLLNPVTTQPFLLRIRREAA
jgi:hypothetical protein